VSDPDNPLTAAHAYAARGWRVIPIEPGHKFPRGFPEWQHDATTNPQIIESWWGRDHPDHGIGIATGAATGMFALDVDPEHGGDETLTDLEHEHGALPDTLEVLTGGGGRHLYFAVPDGVTIANDQGKRLGPGLDIRGEGGQAVAPPSIHPDTGRRYEWEALHDPADGVTAAVPPAWLVELLTVETEPPRPHRTSAGGSRLDLAERPGDRFEAETEWADLLSDDGWSLHSPRRGLHGNYELWTRPGKEPRDGASASLYYQGSDVLKVFTSSVAGLDAGATYTRFGYLTATRHGGDHRRAAQELAQHYKRLDPSLAPATATEEVEARPCIVYNGRSLDDVTHEAIAVVALSNDPPRVFVRGGIPTRIRTDESQRPIIETLSKDSARHRLAEIADWQRINADGERRQTAPPVDVVANVLAADAWPFPGLTGIAEVPILRPDGTFRTEHGYDDTTKLYHWTTHAYPTLPETPTAAELEAAVATVADLFVDFPFDTIADRANAWALVITGIVRPAITGQVPMALLDAPEPGTGKSLLARIAALITTGRIGAMQPMPRSDEELEKRITSLLLAGTTTVIFDNVDGSIASGVLAGALTADVWSGRILGQSTTIEVPSRVTWLATGNNLSIGGDLARRCYRIRLDTHQAQPWRRTGFQHPDLENHVATHRTEIITALCTIVRSWWAAGKPSAPQLPALGGYTPWVEMVGGILAHAGIDGFLGNLEQFHADADTEAIGWEAFLHSWHSTFGDDIVTAGDIVRRMEDPMALGAGGLIETIPDDLSPAWGTPRFAKVFGRALGKRAGRHYGAEGIHIVRHGLDRRKVVQYSVALDDRGEIGDFVPAEHPVADQEEQNDRGERGDTPPPRTFLGYPQKAKKSSQGLSNPRNPAFPAHTRSTNNDEYEPF